jgi:short-subunit dehydrogenase
MSIKAMGKKKSKFVMITGSGRGLGKELALVFAKYGYAIILHDKDKTNLTRTKKQILKMGLECYACLADLRYDSGLNKIYKVIKNKNIYVLINHAGLHCPHLPLERMTAKHIDDIIKVNLIAPIKLTREIYKRTFKNIGGVIININSVCGLEGLNMRSIYSASKWGLRGFAESFRVEVKKRGVRVIDVYPSRIKTRIKFKEGIDPKDAAFKIFGAFKRFALIKLVLDERPKKG